MFLIRELFGLQIRDTAFYLLQEHFSWPLILLENDSTGKASASILLEKALTLVRSPKVQDCESAAVIFRLIQRKYVPLRKMLLYVYGRLRFRGYVRNSSTIETETLVSVANKNILS